MGSRNEDAMNDWQPARIKNVHPPATPEVGEYLTPAEIAALEKKIVSIKPITSPIYTIEYCRRETDCPKGTVFYHVRCPGHPDSIICEHEVLTD
jgi:hypothetical protein